MTEKEKETALSHIMGWDAAVEKLMDRATQLFFKCENDKAVIVRDEALYLQGVAAGLLEELKRLTQ